MGREIRRVALDFDWPLNKIWEGFLSPDKFDETPCPDCESGYSPQAQNLHDLWYGYLPFDPESNGSTPLRHDTPAVRAFAERNIRSAPDYYGSDEAATVREAQRLADLWNGMWCHHLNQADVDALVEGDRLWDFTRTVVPGKGWQPKDPPVAPTADQVNDWNIRTFGHDGINASVVIDARCKREGHEVRCQTCQGHASTEAYPGQRAEAEAWEPTDPPAGEGWQLWETVSEGSPISSVFETSGGLTMWMSHPDRGDDWVPADVAAKFIGEGWAPTGAFGPGTHGVVSGVEWVGTQDDQPA